MMRPQNAISHAENKQQRVLTKVRTHFLRRRPEDEEECVEVSIPKPLDPNTMYIIDPSTGLMEKNRKIFIGVRYLNRLLNIDCVTITNQCLSKVVTLNVGKPDPSKIIPWEYNVKRLESYGDLELAMWGHKVRTYFENYPLHVEQYCRKLEEESRPEIIERMQEISLQIKRVHEDIESRYAYQKFAYRCEKDKSKLISVSFNSALLEQIGQSPEEFACWTKTNGIPTLFEGNSKVGLKLCKTYLDVGDLKNDPISETPEATNIICDINGNKKEVITQYIRTTVPTPYGFEHVAYVILKTKSCENSQESEGNCEALTDEYSQKKIKPVEEKSEC